MTQRQLRDQLAIVKKYGIPRMMSIPKVCKDLLIGICSPEYVCSSSFGLCVALWRYVISSEVGAPALASAVLDFSTISGHAGSGCPSASWARKSM